MKYFIYQANEGDCGFASLKMLLAKLHKNRQYLNLAKPIEKRSGYTIKDLIQIGGENGVKLTAYQYERKFDIIGKDSTAFLAIFKHENSGNHVVMINSFKDDKMEVYDPDKGVATITFEDFLNAWTGQTIEVSDVQKLKKSLPKVRITNKTLNILNYAISAVSVSLLLFAMFFIKDSTHFIIPLVLLVAFALFELAGKLCALKQLSAFDKKYLKKLARVNDENFATEYKNYNKFKEAYFSYDKKFAYNLLICGLIIVVLVINNPIHAIPLLLFLIINIIDRFIIQKQNNKDKDSIALHEEELLKETDRNTRLLLLEQTHKLTYSYVFNISARKCVYNFLLIGAAITMMFVQDVTSVNFIIFEYFIFTVYNDNLDSALCYADKREELNKLKSHFIDTFVY